MVTYGATSAYISLSTGISGSYPVRYPTGSMILLYAEEWEEPRENQDKQKVMANNNSYNNRMGKIGREMNLRRCVMMNDDGSTSNTESYNNKITLLDSWCGITGSAIYMIVTPLVDNPGFAQPNENRTINVALSRKGARTPVDYMKGVPRRLNSKPLGNVYMVDIMYKETTLY